MVAAVANDNGAGIGAQGCVLQPYALFFSKLQSFARCSNG